MGAKSPGIYLKETDLSNYTPNVSMSVCGMVGTASKGPVDEIMLITDEGQLINTFGVPSAEHVALYSAINYLKRGRQLLFVRVAHYDVTAEVDFVDEASVVHGTWSAVSSGSWGNNISVEVEDGSDAGTKRVLVYYDEVLVETFDRLLTASTDDTDANYFITRINGVSDYIYIDLTSTPETIDNDEYVLVGGDDGSDDIVDADYIGIAGTPPTILPTGLQLFANPETVLVDMLAVPGISTDAVISAGITICENRGDCIYLIDPPEGLTVKEVVAWSNGLSALPDAPAAAINSSYAVIDYSWCTVYDGYTQSRITVPPCGLRAGVIAYTDDQFNVFDAPAGETRGLLFDVLDVEHSPTLGERDYMYTSGNVVNPYVKYAGVGTVIWGQRTALRSATARDRINVRRLLCYLKRAISWAVRPLLFEPNIEETWMRLKNIVEPVLADVASRGGLEDYNVVCDETTNTALLRNRNEMLAKIFLTPAKTAEVITLDFVLLASGTSTVTEI